LGNYVRYAGDNFLLLSWNIEKKGMSCKDDRKMIDMEVGRY
jgi:hypothetical protein